MATRLILLLDSLLLFCGSIGLFVVRLTNPRLKGLGWLGGAFAAGAVGALLLFFAPHLHVFMYPLLAHVAILLAFVLVQVAGRELVEEENLFPYLGAVLILLQVGIDFYLICHGYEHLEAMIVQLFIAIQCSQTMSVLLSFAKRELRVSALFTALLLFLFVLANITRILAEAFHLLGAPATAYRVLIIQYSLFLAVALGVAFSFFWMTTAKLTGTLEQAASTDPLTRVYNRRAFLKWSENEKDRSDRNGTRFSVLMIDLDHFKRINDSYGHRTGDAALCAVVEKMQDGIRGIDVIGRWGGEEFSVLLPGASSESALLVAERIRVNVEKIILAASSDRAALATTIRLTVSIGIASYLGRDDAVEELLHRADSALYRAKLAGRNCIRAHRAEAPDFGL